MIDSILAVPGLAETTLEFRQKLARIAEKHGWDADGVAAVISHESKFAPAAVNPSASHATGLIQFIEPTARALGTSTAALRVMPAIDQLDFVERFFERYTRSIPTRIEDWILIPYGRPETVGKSDDFVLDRDVGEGPEARRYNENRALDFGHKGAITVGDLRHSMRYVVTVADGRRIPVPPEETPFPSGGVGGAAPLLAGGVFSLVVGWALERWLT